MVAAMGTKDDPEAGSGPVSSGWGMAGVMAIEVAFVVAQVRVVLCPAFKNIGLAVNCVMVGGPAPATCTVTVCAGADPCAPFAVAL